MHAQDTRTRRADRLRAFDKFALLDHARFAIGDPRVGVPTPQRQCDEQWNESRAGDGDNRNRKNDERKNLLDIGQADDEHSPPTAKVAGEHSQQRTQQRGQGTGDPSDHQRHASGIQCADKDVATQLIGAEEMLEGTAGKKRRLESRGQIDLVRVVSQENWDAQRQDDQSYHQDHSV